MHNVTYVRVVLIATFLIAVTISFGAVSQSSFEDSTPAVRSVPRSELPQPDSLSSTSTYYRLRNDVRRCAFPRCGGYFVKRVNHALTRCPNGKSAPECYVAEINWNGQQEVDSTMALVRGRLLRSSNHRNFDALRVTESWRAASDQAATGKYYRVKDRGIRCITHPCLTYHAALLNSTTHRNVAGVDFSSAGGSEESAANASSAMAQPDGVIVAGMLVPVTGPAGKAYSLRASQFYMRAEQASKPPAKTPSKSGCKRTGCSGQVCSDEDVITTCEFRPEYACYRKARCERQDNGKCGWTQTPELSACLRNPPPL